MLYTYFWAAARTVFGVHILDSLTRQKFKHSSNDCPNAAVGANMKGELVHSCRERQREKDRERERESEQERELK